MGGSTDVRTVLAHHLQFVQERPYRPVHRQFQLDLRHVDLRRQVVLHLRPPENRHRDRLMDFHIVVRVIALGVTALEAQTGKPVPFGQLEYDDFLLLERMKKIVIVAVILVVPAAIVAVVSLWVLVSRAAAAPADYRLEGQFERNQIDLADNNVVGGGFDAVFHEQIGLGKFDKTRDTRIGVFERDPNVFFVKIQDGITAMRVLELGNRANDGMQQRQLIVQQLCLEPHSLATATEMVLASDGATGRDMLSGGFVCFDFVRLLLLFLLLLSSLSLFCPEAKMPPM